MSNSRWELNWPERPTELANLFNPAFGGELIYRAVAAYCKGIDAPMPFALAFIILPLSLHSPTRNVLPRRANAAFASWIADQQERVNDVALRARALRPVTRESLLFMTQLQMISLERGLTPSGRLSGNETSATTDDTAAGRRAASFVGRWFANQSSPSFILQSFGLRP